jgi:hypothetical protein
MEEIREYLRTGKRCLTPEMLNILRTYDYILFDGHKIETDRLLKEFRGCDHCCRLLLRVSALEARLKKYENPRNIIDVDAVLAGFFENNYKRISCRMYSRRKLFQEVKEFLEDEFDICLLNASDVRWRDFIEKIVKDTGKGYKRLRIAKRD